jgi:DNA sulfur modification protein DndB
MKQIYLPGFRGQFGDWVYYACLMPLSELGDRVSFADEVHTNKGLSDMIQRALVGSRSTEIAEYLLTNEQRFFNSLVIAVYGGEPVWHEFGRIRPNRPEIDMSEIPSYAKQSLGFLQFNGKEELYALDGQHRLAGIKEALRRDRGIGEDQVSTIFVAHRKTKSGLRRTRRLFTTLNKTARPVSKSEVIALDEADVMAITARRLVEEHPFFKGNRIAFKHTNNVTLADRGSLTTIGNLYDVLRRIYVGSLKARARGEYLVKLRFYRPSDSELDDYYKLAVNFFERLGDAFPELESFYHAHDPEVVINKYRGVFGGSMLFRPVGLMSMTELVCTLSETYGVDKAFDRVSNLPTDLTQVPYRGVLWDPTKPKILPTGGPLTRRLLMYMLNESTEPETRLRADYARVLGSDVSETQLPRRIRRAAT